MRQMHRNTKWTVTAAATWSSLSLCWGCLVDCGEWDHWRLVGRAFWGVCKVSMAHGFVEKRGIAEEKLVGASSPVQLCSNINSATEGRWQQHSSVSGHGKAPLSMLSCLLCLSPTYFLLVCVLKHTSYGPSIFLLTYGVQNLFSHPLTQCIYM